MGKKEEEQDLVGLGTRIPRDLKQRIKIKAVEEETTVAEIVTEALTAHLGRKP